MRCHDWCGGQVGDVPHRRLVAGADVDRDAELVHPLDDTRPDRAEPDTGTPPDGKSPGEVLPRQGRSAEAVVAEVYQADDPDAAAVPGVDQVDVVAQRICTLDTEHDGWRASCLGRGDPLNRPDDDRPGVSSLSLDSGQLGLDGGQRAAAQVTACHHRVADCRSDHGVNRRGPQHLEANLWGAALVAARHTARNGCGTNPGPCVCRSSTTNEAEWTSETARATGSVTPRTQPRAR